MVLDSPIRYIVNGLNILDSCEALRLHAEITRPDALNADKEQSVFRVNDTP